MSFPRKLNNTFTSLPSLSKSLSSGLLHQSGDGKDGSIPGAGAAAVSPCNSARPSTHKLKQLRRASLPKLAGPCGGALRIVTPTFLSLAATDSFNGVSSAVMINNKSSGVKGAVRS